MTIGIDIVDIARFASWVTRSDAQLSRIFSPEEIVYARSKPLLTAERLAVRFAVREALYKALSAQGIRMPFLQLCKALRVRGSGTGPQLEMAGIEKRIQVSWSHAHHAAVAMVIVD